MKGIVETVAGVIERLSISSTEKKLPARVKCAVLGWHTMEEMLDKQKSE